MRAFLVFVLLFPNLASAEVDLAHAARSVKADKRPLFEALAQSPPGENRLQRPLKQLIALAVLCKIDSDYARGECDREAKAQETKRTIAGFSADQPNDQIVLRSLAGILRGAKLSLTPATGAAADRLIALLGATMANDSITSEDLEAVARTFDAESALFAEFRSGTLGAYGDVLAQLRAWLTSKPVGAPYLEASAGGQVLCRLQAGRVECFGNNQFGQLNVPRLGVAKAIGVGRRAACAIDEAGLHCWGDPETHVPAVPAGLQNPYRVSVGDYTACALDELGAFCWGWGAEKGYRLPDLDPTEIGVSGEGGCVLAAGRLRCWHNGKGYPENILHEELKNPRNLTVSVYSGPCLQDDDGPKCWNLDNKPRAIPAMEGIVSIALARQGSICVIGAKGLLCDRFDEHPKEMPTPRYLVTGSDLFSCAVGESDTRCWGLHGAMDFFLHAPTATANAHGLNLREGCFLEADGPRCWGERAAVNLSAFRRLGLQPKLASFAWNDGAWNLCGTDGHDLRCVGVCEPGQLGDTNCRQTKPSLVLRNPRELAGGFGGTGFCAIDDAGLQCWGEEYPRKDWIFPEGNPLREPHGVIKGRKSVCLIDGGAVKCWQDFFAPPPRPFNLPQAPTAAGAVAIVEEDVIGTSDGICAAEDSGVRCWGDLWYKDSQLLDTYAMKLRNPRRLVVSSDSWTGGVGETHVSFFCVLDDDGVQCRGINNAKLSVPALSHPRELDGYGASACALDDTGVKCWSY